MFIIYVAVSPKIQFYIIFPYYQLRFRAAAIIKADRPEVWQKAADNMNHNTASVLENPTNITINAANHLPLKKIFQYYIDRGIIDLDDVMNSEKEVIMKTILDNIHNYAIKRSKDGRYTTYVPDNTKPNGRRQVRKKSQTELYRFLLEFYGIEEDPESINENMSFCDLYTEWVDYKRQFIGVANKKRSLSPSTIRRYERDFDAYIRGTEFANTSIGELTAPKLEMMIINMIRKHSLKEHCAKNIIGYICQTFAYARRASYIRSNPCDLIDKALLLSTCRFTPPKKDEDRILTKMEMTNQRESVSQHEQKYPYYMPDYAIELSTLTGMRVGELAALHWSDIDDEYIHIDYSEHRLDYADKPSELEIGEPKNGKHRRILLTDEIRDVLSRAKKVSRNNPGDFIFTRRDGSRYTAHDISCAVDRRASEAQVSKTSIHSIRRTVSSLLNTILPQRVVAEMLGHTERVNEQCYNYSTAENAEKAAALSKLSSWYSAA